MHPSDRIERALERAVDLAQGSGAPPLLASALRYAVFPGGHRIRPQLCLAVARACGDADPRAADAGGRGDRTAALRISRARRPALFRRRRHAARQALGSRPVWRADRRADRRRADRARFRDSGARASARPPLGCAWLVSIVAAPSARRAGIVAGQAWECEARRAAGRLSSGQDGRPVRRLRPRPAPPPAASMPNPGATLGEKLGEAYQVADDLRDVLCDAEELGKPIGQDAVRCGRTPRRNSASAAPRRISRTSSKAAVDSIPPCPGGSGASQRSSRRRRRSSFPSNSPASRPELASPDRRVARRRGQALRLPLQRALERLAQPADRRSRASSAGRRRSPLTRGSRERRARALFDLCAGFVYSQILRACVQLTSFDRSREGPRTLAGSPRAMDLTLEAARRLLRAAASLSSCAPWPDDRFAPRRTGRGDASATPASPLSSRITLCSTRDLADPVALLRGEVETCLAALLALCRRRPGDPPEAASRPRSKPKNSRAYSDLMSQTQTLVAEDVLDAYPFHRRRCLLDVGGGDGAFVAAVAKRAPLLAFKLFDLPAVAARAPGLDSRLWACPDESRRSAATC